MKDLTIKQWELLFMSLSECVSEKELKEIYNEISEEPKLRKEAIASKSNEQMTLSFKNKMALAVFDKSASCVKLKDFKTVELGNKEIDLTSPLIKKIEDNLKYIDTTFSDTLPTISEVLIRENPLPDIEQMMKGHNFNLSSQDLSLKISSKSVELLGPEDKINFSYESIKILENEKEKIINVFEEYKKFYLEHKNDIEPGISVN